MKPARYAIDFSFLRPKYFAKTLPTAFVAVLLPFWAACTAITIRGEEEIIEAKKIRPIVNAYAENDYVQNRPLLDSLELGFRHIEADTFLVDDKLLVGNSVLDMQSKGTLEELYLAPLNQLVKNRSELVIGNSIPFRLFVDIKSEAGPTYQALKKLIDKYASVLTRVEDNKVKPGAITIIVSGNYPRETIVAENPRYVAMDGRISDLNSDAPAHLIPIISARWGSHFRWQGKREITEIDELRLNVLAEQAHLRKRMLRFWSTPDVELVWATLRKAKVDLIGAERVSLLSDFLIPRKSPFVDDAESIGR